MKPWSLDARSKWQPRPLPLREVEEIERPPLRPCWTDFLSILFGVLLLS